MGVTDEIKELEDSLQGFDKLLIQTNKDALMLKSTLSGVNVFVTGKNYEIISRFLSGTGAWRVLNKAKATVLSLIQLVSVQERAALQDNLRMKEMAKLIRDRKELLALESKFKDAAVSKDRILIEQLKEKSDVFAASAMMVGDDEALSNILKRLGRTKSNLDRLLGGSPKRQMMSLADIERRKQHRELLTDGKTNSLLIAAGLGTNLHQLLKIAKNTNAEAAFHKASLDYDKRRAKLEKEIIFDEKTGEMRNFSKDEILQRIGERPEATKQDIGRIQKFLDRLKEASLTTRFKGALGTTKDNLDNFTLERIGKSKNLGADLKGGFKFLRDMSKGEMNLTERFRKFHRKALDKTIKGFAKIGSFLKQFLYYFTVLTVVGFILYRAFKDLYPILETGFDGVKAALAFAFVLFSEGIGAIIEGLGLIREGFVNGDFFKVLEGLFSVFAGGLFIFMGLIAATLGSVYGFLAGAIFQFLTELVSGGERTVKAVTGVLYLLGAILIGIGLFVTGTWIPVFAGLILSGVAALISKISPFASGGVTGAGMQLVGERGPELVKLPRGSRVYSNRKSAGMLSGGTTNNITVQVTGRVGASDTEIRDIANKVAREINVRMNQTRSTVSML